MLRGFYYACMQTNDGETTMINYCVDYYKTVDNYIDDGTFICSSDSERQEVVASLMEDGYTVAEIYENEDCYCHARYEGECACGNFK